MSKFTYDDRVRVATTANREFRPGEIAWVIAVLEERPRGEYLDQFPPGVIYTVEYEDGEAIDIHESDLEPIDEIP